MTDGPTPEELAECEDCGLEDLALTQAHRAGAPVSCATCRRVAGEAEEPAP